MSEDRQECTVLVVDDDDVQRRLLRRWFQDIAGWRVIEAPHGDAGLLMYAEHRPHVVVTDFDFGLYTSSAELRDGVTFSSAVRKYETQVGSTCSLIVLRTALAENFCNDKPVSVNVVVSNDQSVRSLLEYIAGVHASREQKAYEHGDPSTP